MSGAFQVRWLVVVIAVLMATPEGALARGFGGGFGGGGFRGGMGGGGYRGGMGGGYRGGFGGGYGGGYHGAGYVGGGARATNPGIGYRGAGGMGMRGTGGVGRGALGGAHPAGRNPGGAGNGLGGHANRSSTFSNPSYASRFGGERGGTGSGLLQVGAGGNRGGIANRGGAGTGIRNPMGGGVGNRTGVANRSFNGNTINMGNRNVNLAGAGYRPSYYNHGFYHGYWNGHYGYGYGWGGGFWARPWYWGAGAWGLGMLAYDSGYYGYYNPYYNGGGNTVVYNYSQPIPVNYTAPASDAAEPAQNDSSTDDLQPAMDAFKANDYDTAVDLVNAFIRKKPGDAVAHEFRALALFARGDFLEAAATIHSVLAVGPGWDYTTLSKLYGNINDYQTQVAALEQFVQKHKDSGSAHFLLGYHYLTEGHADQAAEQFKTVVTLVPKDKVAADLLKMLTPPSDQSSATADASNTSAPPAPQAESQTVDPMKLVGTWQASRKDGSSFQLALPADKSFSWKFAQGDKHFDFEGTWDLEGDLLTLERKDGGSLLAKVRLNDDGSFQLHMLGEPDTEPGLTFRQQ